MQKMVILTFHYLQTIAKLVISIIFLFLLININAKSNELNIFYKSSHQNTTLDFFPNSVQNYLLNINNSYLVDKPLRKEDITSEFVQDLITKNVLLLEIGGMTNFRTKGELTLSPIYMLNLGYGRKIYDRTYLGGGLGFKYFKEDSKLLMPFFLSLNTITNKSNVSPYFGFKSGYNFNLKDSFNPVGEIFSGQFGLGFKQTEKLNEQFDFTYYLVGGISYETMMINGNKVESIGLFFGFIP